MALKVTARTMKTLLIVQALLVFMSCSSATGLEEWTNFAGTIQMKQSASVKNKATGGAAAARVAGDIFATCSDTEEFTVAGGIDPALDGCYELDLRLDSDFNAFVLGGVVEDGGKIFHVSEDSEYSVWVLSDITLDSTTSGGNATATVTIYCFDQDFTSATIATHPTQVETWVCSEDQLGLSSTLVSNFPLTLTCGACSGSVHGSEAPTPVSGSTTASSSDSSPGATDDVDLGSDDSTATCSGTEEFTVTGGIDPALDGCYELNANVFVSDFNTFALDGAVEDGGAKVFWANEGDDGNGHFIWTLSDYVVGGSLIPHCLDQDLTSVTVATHPSQVVNWLCLEQLLAPSSTPVTSSLVSDFPLILTCGCSISDPSDTPAPTSAPTRAPVPAISSDSPAVEDAEGSAGTNTVGGGFAATGTVLLLTGYRQFFL